MIAQTSWFKQRKYSGWGLSPSTWQGWLYILVLILPIILISFLPSISPTSKKLLVYAWVGVILVDVIDVMIRMKKDEREYLHEAIAERNVAWFLIFSLAIGLITKTAISASYGNPSLDPYLLLPLLGATIVKAITHLYLRDK